MPSRKGHPLAGEMLQGALDLLILQTLVLGPAHGHTIAQGIEQRSEDVLQVEYGSLYIALTAGGRKQLHEHTSRWDRLVRAVNRVLHPAEQ